jgi:hypothetical protein
MDKNIIHLKLFLVILKAIQAILLIDEYLKIFRIDIRLNMPTAPIRPLKKIENTINEDLILLKIYRGISFCHVLKKSKGAHINPSITSGNQKI